MRKSSSMAEGIRKIPIRRGGDIQLESGKEIL